MRVVWIGEKVFLMKISSQDELISELARRTRFIKGDTKILLDGLVSILEDLVRDHEPFKEGEKKKLLLKSRGLGALYLQLIPERKGKDGQMLPPTTRPVLKLSENIRYANKSMVDIEENEDLDTLDTEE